MERFRASNPATWARDDLLREIAEGYVTPIETATSDDPPMPAVVGIGPDTATPPRRP